MAAAHVAGPAFATRANGPQLPVYADDEIGPWVAAHGLTPDGYQQQFDKLTPQGYFPAVVQAAGASAATARFDTLFVKRETPTARAWHAAGPVANAAIDAVMRGAMQ